MPNLAVTNAKNALSHFSDKSNDIAVFLNKSKTHTYNGGQIHGGAKSTAYAKLQFTYNAVGYRKAEWDTGFHSVPKRE